VQEYKYLIYALQDPITMEIRYVGKSSSGLKRPTFHLKRYYYESKKMYDYPIYRWIRKNISLYGLLPKIIILQQFENINIQDLNSCEKYWISYFSDMKLLNCTIGGDGCVGYRYTDKQKKNLSNIRKGKKLTEETKIKYRISIQKARDIASLDKEEHRKKVSLGTKLWWKNLDSKTRVKLKKQLIPGNNKLPILDQFGNKYKSLTEASKKLNCDVSAISQAIKQNRPCKGYIFTRSS